MSVNEEKLNELSEKLGIYLSFTDYDTGKTYLADVKSKQVICSALGYKANTDQAVENALKKLENRLWIQGVEETHTAYKEELQPLIFEMALPKTFEEACISFELHKEDDTQDNGSFWFHDMPYVQEKEIDGICYQKRRIYLFLTADFGYHEMYFILPDGRRIQMHLLVVPQTCYQPPQMQENKYMYGFPVQVYALQSKKNFGIGDFSDLKHLITLSKKLHADIIGINPLSALFEDVPQDASPYSASSRLFLNPLYVDVLSVPEFQKSAEVRELIQSPKFQKTLTAVRKSEIVDYVRVSALKHQVFTLLYQTFKKTKNKKRMAAFLRFCVEKGQDLENFAVFQALRFVLNRQNTSLYWRDWEKGFQNPNSAEIKAFKKSHTDLINEIKYRQFIAFEQYEKVIQTVEKRHFACGLYTDMPVGVCANSAEVWSCQNMFLENVSAGAPPDSFNQKGQDWGLAAFHPLYLAQTGFQGYRAVIRQIMHGAGAVRIDHAFGLERLFLRVSHASGAYLKYPYKTLMGIIALESMRAQCMVIAEDLGTAPCGFSEKMTQASAYSFKILHFHRQGDTLLSPSCFPYYSLIASGTHDMPSYGSFYQGTDLKLFKWLKTVTSAQHKILYQTRLNDKQAFINAFERAGYPMPEKREKITVDSETTPLWFIENTYRYLNEAESRLLMVRLEDIFEQNHQTNVPGTCFEYPNWRYKLPVFLEDFLKSKFLNKIVQILSEKRGHP